MFLSDSEIRFLEHHGFKSEDVFDARYMSAEDAKEEAKRLGKKFIVGPKACDEAGHRLRTRSRHCIQCKPSRISHGTRFQKYGYVYIAGSLSKKLIKVGFTEDINHRRSTLNSERQASADDWCLLLHFKTEQAGRIESEIQKLLKSYASPQTYSKQGKTQIAKEVFSCSFRTAYDALNLVGAEHQLCPEDPWRISDHSLYDVFPNIRQK